VCARRFAAGFELALHVAIQVRAFENACCNEIILCRVNNVSPLKIETAVKRLRARRCVVKKFDNVNVILATEVCQFLCPVVSIARIINDQEGTIWHQPTPNWIRCEHEHVREASSIVTA
jgi:hypothetical protein